MNSATVHPLTYLQTLGLLLDKTAIVRANDPEHSLELYLDLGEFAVSVSEELHLSVELRRQGELVWASDGPVCPEDAAFEIIDAMDEVA